MKDTYWCILGAVFIISVVYFKCYHDFGKEECSRKESSDAWAQCKLDEERFNIMFAPIVEMSREKDIEVYSLLANKDREILARINEIIAANPSTNTNIRKWSDKLIREFKYEIRDCERLKAQKDDKEDSSASKARWHRCDTFTVNCECCAHD